MKRDGHEQVNFFVGTEIEQTPALGLNTLFVVGVQPVDEIAYHFNKHPDGIEHIYFGANHSFPGIPVNNGSEWAKWERMIYYFLDLGYLCTLDVDVACVEGLIESGLTERHNFIPMISVKLPYLQQLGYNATIKLDDKDFSATNPGIWCHSLHNLLDRKCFTSWSEYSNDKTL
jgi:hypothetical protein